MSKQSRARARASATPSANASAARGAATPSAPATFWARWGILVAGGVIVLAALAAYHNSFSGPLIYDDSGSITKNPTIWHLWRVGEVLSPPRDVTVGGRPLLNLSLALNYAISGDAVWSYHVLNLIIHVLAALALFGIVRRTLLRLAMAGRGSQISNLRSEMLEPTWLALAVALLWVVHPLQTECVTYIIQRAESLMGLFYLLTLYCFIRSADETGERQVARGERPEKKTQNPKVIRPPASGLWPLASVFFCLLGMATKEVMVSAPLMVLLYDRTFVAGTFGEAWKKRWRFYAGLACTWLLLGYLVATTGSRGGTAGFGSGISTWTYALTQFRAIVQYLRLSIWPHPLVLDYGRPVLQRVAQAAPYAVVIVTLVALTAAGLWRNRALGFLGAWFFAILAPSSSVVPVVTETMAEHRMYLALAAVIVWVVWGLYRLLGRRSVVICLAMAVGLGALTARRNEDYRSELAIWRDNVAKTSDNPWAHLNLGKALLATGSWAEAREQLETAVRIEPRLGEAYNNLGVILDKEGRMKEAMEDYRQAAQLTPGLTDAHYNLAIGLHRLGRLDEAIEQYEEVVKATPYNAVARCDLGGALAQQGHLAAAVAQLEEAVRIAPKYAGAHYNLGNVLAQSSRLPEAIAEYKIAIQIKPEYAEAHHNLGTALFQSGRLSEAIAQYELAVQFKPDLPGARKDLEQVRNAMQNPSGLEGAGSMDSKF
jgi:tetratricopeptide (TPR) repeat protein